MKDNSSSEIARFYRKLYPELPSLKLARIMYNDNKLIFTNVEHARYSLRYIEGKCGEKLKKSMKDKSLVKEVVRPYNPYNVPASDESEYPIYNVLGNRIGILSDIHVPYHSVKALTKSIEWLQKKNIDTLLLNGDFFDIHSLSKHVRDPRKKSFAEELKIGAELIRVFQKELTNNIVYKLGNHDERYQKFLFMKGGELAGIKHFDFKNILTSEGINVDVIGEKRIVKIGGLNVLHGHELTQTMGAISNVAKRLYNKTKVSTICGHYHKPSENTETTMSGETITTWSTGCLCELHPEYMPINEWGHGFAYVERYGDEFYVENKRIINNKVY